MIKNKNIFITGLNGSIAKRFIYLLDKSLINSTFYVSTSSKIFNLNLVNKIKTFKLDENFKDIKKCKKVLKKCDYLFHLSYQNSEKFAFDNTEEDYKINLLGLFNLLDAAKENKKLKFIFTSTVSLYKSTSRMLNEDSELEILSFYNLHKYSCEKLIKFHEKKSKNKFIILRLSNVYGDKDVSKRDFVLDSIDKIKNKKKITIFGDGKYYRDFIHIDDVTKALLGIIKKKKIKKFSIYNLTSGNSIQIIELIKIIYDAIKYKKHFFSKIKFVPNYSKLIERNFFAKSKKFEKTFNWKPNIKIKEGIKSLIFSYL
jgi:nucleoside-diphosphate-sugar epimerase